VISGSREQRILIVDDDPAVREALSRALELEGYGVLLAADGSEGISRLQAEGPDLVLLDVAMPVMDGLKACRRIRNLGDRTPVLMLTARESVPDRVSGLDAGADDYLVKPFALAELNARVKALLRRGDGGGGVLCFADLALDPASCEVRRGERPIELTRTEFLMLELFLRHPRQVLSRDQISEGVWNWDFGPASNSINVYVGYLRKKLEAAGEPRLVHTVRSVGYILRNA
jgi:two-component system response regulator MprA